MKNHSEAIRFIVCGTHITENLEHHKANDVRRILEDKGYKPVSDGNDCCYIQERGTDSGKRTVIVFDEGGFVQAGDGVQFYESPEAAGTR